MTRRKLLTHQQFYELTEWLKDQTEKKLTHVVRLANAKFDFDVSESSVRSAGELINYEFKAGRRGGNKQSEVDRTIRLGLVVAKMAQLMEEAGLKLPEAAAAELESIIVRKKTTLDTPSSVAGMRDQLDLR